MIEKKIENVTIELHNEDGDKFVVLRIADRPGFNFMLKQEQDDIAILDVQDLVELIEGYDEPFPS